MKKIILSICLIFVTLFACFFVPQSNNVYAEENNQIESEIKVFDGTHTISLIGNEGDGKLSYFETLTQCETTQEPIGFYQNRVLNESQYAIHRKTTDYCSGENPLSSGTASIEIPSAIKYYLNKGAKVYVSASVGHVALSGNSRDHVKFSLTVDGVEKTKTSTYIWGPSSTNYSPNWITFDQTEVTKENSVIKFSFQTDDGFGGNDSKDFYIFNPTITFTVEYEQETKSEVSIEHIAVKNKGYDGTTTAEIDYVILDGVNFGEGEYLTGLKAEFNSENAGATPVISGTPVLHEADGVTLNPEFSSATVSGKILKRDVVISAKETSQVYGASEQTIIEYGVFNAEEIQLTGNLSREFVDKKEVEEYRITIGDLTAGDNYNLILHSNKYIIKTAEIIIESVEINKDYDGTNDVEKNELTINLGIDTDEDGLIDVYFNLGENGKLTDKENAIVKYFETDNVFLNYYCPFSEINAGEYSINNFSAYLTGTDLKSYSLNSDKFSTTATINQIEITIEADEKTKVYGEDDPKLTYSITSGALIEGESLKGELGRESGKDVRTYVINIGTLQTNNPNYNITFIGNNLEITKRELKIKAIDAEKRYGELDPNFEYEIIYGSLVGEDKLNLVLVTNSKDKVDTYTITAKTDQNGKVICNDNYFVSEFEDGVFTINKNSLTIIITVSGKVYDGKDSATYEIEYVTTSETFNSEGVGIDTSKLEAKFINFNAGQQTVKFYYNDVEKLIEDFSADIVEGAKKENYDISFEINNTAKIEKRNVTVKPYQNYEKQYGDFDPAFKYIAEGIVDEKGLIGVLSRQQGEDPDEYDIIPGTITNENNPNYNITFIEGKKLTITKRLVKVEVENSFKIYGEKDPDAVLKVSQETPLQNGVVLEDLVEGIVAREEGDDFGDYKYLQGTVALNVNSNELYTLEFVEGGKLTIEKREIKISIENVTVKYGEKFSFNYEVVGAYQPLSTTDINILPRETAVNAGEYNLIAFANENYLITYENNATLTIKEAEITIVPTYQSKIYGDNWGDNVVNNKYEIVQGQIFYNDDLIDSGRFKKEEGENVGFYGIHQGNAVFNSNYNVTIKTNQSFEIKRRPINVRAVSVCYYLDIYENPLTHLILEYKAEGLFAQEIAGEFVQDALYGTVVLENEIKGVGSTRILQGSVTNENNPNYDITYFEGSVEIKRRKIIITSFHEMPNKEIPYEPARKIYDGTTSYPEGVNPTNFVHTFAVENGLYRNDEKEVDDIFNGITLSCKMEKNVGGYEIKINLPEENLETINKYYEVVTRQNSIFIDPRPFEIKIIGKEFVYGEGNPTADDLVCEFNENEIVKTPEGKSTLTIKLKCENLVYNKGRIQAGEYQVELEDPKNANYKITVTYDNETGGKLVVHKRKIEVEISSLTKVYGDDDPEIVYSYDRSMILDDDVITENVYREKGENAGEYNIIVDIKDENGNYEFVYNEPTFTIYKRTISLEVTPQSKVHDGTTNVDIQYNYGNIKQGDDIKVNIEGKFVDANIGNNKEIVITKWEIIGQNSGNYQIASQHDLTANITRKSISVENVTITVEDDNTLLDENVELKVKKLENKDIKVKLQGKKIVTAYEIILERNGLLITDFGGDLTVRINELYPAVKEEMFVVNQNGKSYLVETTVDQEGVIFETRNLGTVVVAHDKNNVLLYSLIGAGAGLILIGSIIATILIVKKRKNK